MPETGIGERPLFYIDTFKYGVGFFISSSFYFSMQPVAFCATVWQKRMLPQNTFIFPCFTSCHLKNITVQGCRLRVWLDSIKKKNKLKKSPLRMSNWNFLLDFQHDRLQIGFRGTAARHPTWHFQAWQLGSAVRQFAVYKGFSFKQELVPCWYEILSYLVILFLFG